MAGTGAVGTAVGAAFARATALTRAAERVAGRAAEGAATGARRMRRSRAVCRAADATAPEPAPAPAPVPTSATVPPLVSVRRALAAAPAALLAAALAAGVTACGGTTPGAGPAGGQGGARPAAGAGATPGASGAPSAAASGTPDAGRLKAALLTPHDIGLNSSPSSSTAGAAVTGCEPLAAMMSAPAQGETQVRAAFVGDAAGGPFVQEALTTEAQPRMTADYAKLSAALRSCRSLTFTVGGTRLTMALTPIDFGGAGAVARRMDTTVQGVEVNGYLAVDRIGPVVLGYAYLQAGSGSSQLASYFYRQAVAKADRAFAGGTGVQAAGRPA